MTKILKPTRRDILKVAAAAPLAMPFVSRAWAETVEINMLAWYGHGEPDVVGEFEAANNVKFKPKYYAGGDNMLALIAQSCLAQGCVWRNGERRATARFDEFVF